MPTASLTIIDHKINNLKSITNAVRALGLEPRVVTRGEELRDAGHAILPGVGAFGASMDALEQTGLGAAIQRHVRAGRPFLGICLGFQVLFTEGTEGGARAGLGLFDGKVARFDGSRPVPHVGWNSVERCGEHPVFKDVHAGTHMYFVHSYRPEDVPERQQLARTSYGESFVSAAHEGSAVGTQFHPEKSGADGLRLLRNFSHWRP